MNSVQLLTPHKRRSKGSPGKINQAATDSAAPAPSVAGPHAKRTRTTIGAGAAESSLGNIQQKFTPPPGVEGEKAVSRNQEGWNHRYGQYMTLWQWEQEIQAEMDSLIARIRGLQEPSIEALERLSALGEELVLVKHASRTCGLRMIPSDARNGRGEKYKTGMSGSPSLHTGYKGNTEKFHFVGVKFCASPFFCLSCARSIYAKRRSELVSLFEYCRSQKHSFFFVTLTHPHTNSQTLQETMSVLGEMRRKLRVGSPWKRFKDRYGVYGIVTATEITRSDRAGWHPHFHMVFVCDRPEITPEEIQEIQSFLSRQWSNLAVRYGLVSEEVKRQEHLSRGVMVQAGTDKAQFRYLGKFDCDESNESLTDHKKAFEMASADSKSGRNFDSMTHWEVSALAHSGHPKFKALWFDFMKSMKGRPAVQWSHGLKALAGLKDIPDEDIVQGKKATEVYQVTRSDYQKINKQKAHCEVLEACESEAKGGESAVALVKRQFDVDLIPSESDSTEVPDDDDIEEYDEYGDWLECVPGGDCSKCEGCCGYEVNKYPLRTPLRWPQVE